MNTHVDFETAKLLKEKGFDNESEHYYNEKGEMLFDTYFPSLQPSKPNVYYDNPTTSEVVMWLYEKHGIWISCVVWENAPHFLSKVFIMNDFTESKNIGSFNSPTEAYQEAIKYCLTKII